jgi:hypothetical protein
VADDSCGVGYRKPPKDFQFQKGRSGNPSGRPRKAPGFGEILEKAARRKVLVRGKNGPRYITAEEAIGQQLVNKAAGGDLKAIDLYVKFRMIYSSGMVKPEDMDAMASSLKAKLLEMFEAGEESSGEDTADTGQSSDQANAIAPERQESEEPARHPVEGDGVFDLLDEHCAAQTPENHATFNSTNPTNPLLPESPLQDQGEDAAALADDRSRSGIERSILCEGFRELETGGDSLTALQNLPEVESTSLRHAV